MWTPEHVSISEGHRAIPDSHNSPESHKFVDVIGSLAGDSHDARQTLPNVVLASQEPQENGCPPELHVMVEQSLEMNLKISFMLE